MKHGSGPCELLMMDSSTFRQVIQYYYYLIHVKSSAYIIDITP